LLVIYPRFCQTWSEGREPKGQTAPYC